MLNPQYVTIIADYGPLNDLAFAEVEQKLLSFLPPTVHVLSHSVEAFDTVATGFKLAQLALNSDLPRHIFFVNTAPRRDDPAARVNNAGEKLSYAKLHNGVEVVIVNAGYALSFVKKIALEIRTIKCGNEGTQFRSRDIYPAMLGRIAAEDYSVLGDDIRDNIPDLPKGCVVYTDGYGNLKMSILMEDIEAKFGSFEKGEGQKILVDIGGYRQEAVLAKGIFGVPEGGLVFAPGSSGWVLEDGRKIQLFELSVRGGRRKFGTSAADLFARPDGGARVNWWPAGEQQQSEAS